MMMNFLKKILKNTFKSNWVTYFPSELIGNYGAATVILKNLECEKHILNHHLRFTGEYGGSIYEYLWDRWAEVGNSPSKMLNGSPWNWLIEVDKFQPLSIVITYSSISSKAEMVSDTLDAIIEAMEGYKKE